MVYNVTIIQANVAEIKSRFSHYLRLAKAGEKVVICERNRPVAELTPIVKPVDIERRKAFFGMFTGSLDLAQIDEAMRPMTDQEADDFIEGRY